MGDGVEDAAAAVVVESAEVLALKARLVQSELKAAAIRAGIVDVDGVKLIDMTKVKTTEGGELVDGAGVIQALKAAKPWLFGGSSSSSAMAPRAEVAAPKAAMEMDQAEWRAARAALLKRR